jgi:hypothetical protein
MMVCKAWVAASCDAKHGSKQSGKDFEDALGQLMGMEKDDIEHYSSTNEKRKYASSLLCLQSAQLECQAIELEEENARCYKIRKDNGGAPVESCEEEHVVESSSDDDMK